MRVAIRVDASAEKGLGHFVRCCSLAEALSELGSRVIFVFRDLGLDLLRRVESAGFDGIYLPPIPMDDIIADDQHTSRGGVSWEFDAHATILALIGTEPSLVVVDHYSFDSRWHDIVAAGLSADVVAIDDLGDRAISARVLIDHNLDALAPSKYCNVISSHTKLLAGPRFALLGHPYRDATRYQFNSHVRSVGIFMGGVDKSGLSSAAIRGCREVAGFRGPIEVATTRANPHLQELSLLVAASQPATISIDMPDLAAFFARHDVQIGAGGGASLERVAVGVPSLLLVTAENQRGVVRSMVELGAAVGLDSFAEASKETIGLAFRDLAENADVRRRMVKVSADLVDGRGALRAAAYLQRREIAVRAANIADVDMIFHWRNHSSTRILSLDTLPLDFDDHVAWMRRTLDDASRHLLVGHIGRLDVGVVRFDELSSDSAEVSIYLNPDLHRLDLGAPLLRAAETEFRIRKRAAVRFIATVLDANVASNKLFRSCEYIFSNGHWCKAVAAPSMHGV